MIRWYVDGTLFLTLTDEDIPEDTEWVFDHPFFLIMNVAVGGTWPGYPDETTVFPQTMEVDYIRVYQAPDTAERFETIVRRRLQRLAVRQPSLHGLRPQCNAARPAHRMMA